MAALATIRYPGKVRQQIFRPGLSLGAGYDAGWVEDAGRGQGEKARLHIQPKFCGKGARRWLKPTGQARREQPELEACQSLPRPCTSLPLSVRSYPGPQSRVPPPPASSPLPMSADDCAFRERRPNEPHSSSQDAGTEREMPSHMTPSRTSLRAHKLPLMHLLSIASRPDSFPRCRAVLVPGHRGGYSTARPGTACAAKRSPALQYLSTCPDLSNI